MEELLFMRFNKKWLTQKELCYIYHVGYALESKCTTSKCSELFSTNCPLTSDVHIIPRFRVVFELLVLTGRATSSPSSRHNWFQHDIDELWQISVVFLCLGTPTFKCITPKCSWLSSAGCPLTSEVKYISICMCFFSCVSFNITYNLISPLIDISDLLLLVKTTVFLVVVSMMRTIWFVTVSRVGSQKVLCLAFSQWVAMDLFLTARFSVLEMSFVRARSKGTRVLEASGEEIRFFLVYNCWQPVDTMFIL